MDNSTQTDPDNKISKKEIHRAVRNVMANEMQITPEMIQHIAITVIESRINQFFNNFNLDSWIANQVRASWLRKPYSAADFGPNIERAIYNQIEKELKPVIEQWIQNQVQVTVSANIQKS